MQADLVEMGSETPLNFVLNTGAFIPSLGLGTVIGPSDSESSVVEGVLYALEVGYRHFDTASLYTSETALGKAFKEAFQKGLVSRDEIFVTTKLWNTHHDPERALVALKESLQIVRQQINGQEFYTSCVVFYVAFSFRGLAISAGNKNLHVFLQISINQTWSMPQKALSLFIKEFDSSRSFIRMPKSSPANSNLPFSPLTC
ncbi:hypothetical protein O6H91_09G020700 [Diphasiastrum complanatum]|uniref:Uncharacterized protein n=1 Tax=Diphasiastrum complanatum TaxID=34168 RepID=A0ACC2CMQ4_DIPCM|nr:hypothetical protein O6H91_09G020700 [Diphasiastrum complanatum]